MWDGNDPVDNLEVLNKAFRCPLDVDGVRLFAAFREGRCVRAARLVHLKLVLYCRIRVESSASNGVSLEHESKIYEFFTLYCTAQYVWCHGTTARTLLESQITPTCICNLNLQMKPLPSTATKGLLVVSLSTLLLRRFPTFFSTRKHDVGSIPRV